MNEVCILVMNLNNQLDFKKFSKFVDQKFASAKVVIASKIKHKSTFDEYVFESDNPDEVINSLINKIEAKKLVLVREFDNNNFDPIYNVYCGVKKDNHICILSKKQNKVKAFFVKIWQVVIHFLFGYYLMEGSLAYVAFGEVPFDVLKQTDNPSLYTKIDRWSGVEINRIEASSMPKVKFKPKLKNHIIRLSCMAAVFLIPIFLWIFVKYIQNSIALKLLSVFIMALCVSLGAIEVLLMITKLAIGDNTYENAKIKNKAKSQKD